MRQLSSLSRLGATMPRLYLHTLHGVREPSAGRGRAYWVVARDLSRFFRVPMVAGATVKQQMDALALQTTRLSPYEETGSHCHFGPDFISLWVWDQAVERQAAEAMGVDFGRLRILPEAALVPAADEGVRLIETLDGFEGQSWSNGCLAASRLWPAPPDDRAWVLFQRGASVPPDRITATAPLPMQLDWLARPWTRSRLSPGLGLGQVNLQYVAACAAAVFLVAFGYLGTEWLRLERDIHAVHVEAKAHAGQIEPVVKARATALADAAALAGLRKLDPYPTQLGLMARVAEIMPQNETRLVDWVFERGQLQLTVAAVHRLDALFFVRALQGIKGFKNVESSRAFDENSLRLKLVVDPR
jgi:hypothetical protein